MELPQIALEFSESVKEKLRQVEAFRSVTATYLVPFVGELSGIYRTEGALLSRRREQALSEQQRPVLYSCILGHWQTS